MWKKRIIGSILLLAVIGGGFYAYSKLIAPTRIALINYPDFQVAKMVKSNKNSWIFVDPLPLEELDGVRSYDAALIFGRDLKLEPEQVALLKSAGATGVKMYMENPTDPSNDTTNMRGETLDYVADYIKYGGIPNYREMMNFIRVRINNKSLFSAEVNPPKERPQDLAFWLDEEEIFETIPEFEAFALERGIHKIGAPKIAILTSVPGPFNANRDHVDGLITRFLDKGYNVYPVAAVTGRLRLLKGINPDALVYMPHGGLTLNEGDAAVAWLKERNIPMFGPISVFQNYDEWNVDQQGMAGALLTMSIVLPEFDGGINSYAIAAQYSDEFGYQIFKPIPDRMDKFVEMVGKWAYLRRTDNHDKKLAIYYYKGPGKNAMTAGGLEVAESLYNTLKELRASGYSVTDLPDNVSDFKKLIQQKGPVLGPYAKGDLGKFFEEGDPALVSATTYDQWCIEELVPAMCEAVTERYGRAPGDYMAHIKDGIEYIAVARVEFGNVVIIPQPLPGIGENTFALVHGTREAPPHPYVTSYLWSRKEFKADAVMHFGTHGSLEFTPWKQVALSNMDWSDALIGNTPHFYIYTINNVGEAIIAKRRSYATVISHLTAPFMESGLNSDLKEISDNLFKYHQMDGGAVKASYGRAVAKLANEMGIVEQLKIGKVEGEWSEEDFFALANHVESLSHEKVNAGLYTINQVYTSGQIDTTTKLIATDPLAYSLSKLDELNGKVTPLQLDDKGFFDVTYRQPARSRVERVLAGADPETIIKEVVSDAERTRANTWLRENRDLSIGEIVGGFIALGSEEVVETENAGGNIDDELNRAKDALVSALGQEDKADLIEQWRSEKQFEMSSLALDPESFERAKSIAKAIPQMAAGLKLVEEDDMFTLLELMQRPMVYDQVFAWKDDPSLADSVAAERREQLKAKQATALDSKNITLLSYGLNDVLLDGQIKKQEREDLQSFQSALQFYAANPEISTVLDSDNPSTKALMALLSVDNFADRINTAERKISEKIRKLNMDDRNFAEAVQTIETNVNAIAGYREALEISPRREMDSMLNALNGGYVAPTSGGDLIRNPRTLPTGRNMYSIDSEQTPSRAAWEVGVTLSKRLLDEHVMKTGGYPKKVTFTLWPGDFIQTEGAQLAQVLYLLGFEPVRDPFNRVVTVRAIPLETLGRPRIDIVAQTAGQFRDLAASRIYLINKAVEMAAALDEAPEWNYVRAGVMKSEQLMINDGISPIEARELATTRVFGGVNGRYGTGIMGMVEKGDSWENDKEVAEQYLSNMGAVYGKGDKWGMYREGVFKAALADAEVVVQPRESNAWGALSLDHVYEFMGGLNLAVRDVTGSDPKAYFNDFRNSNQANVQSMEDAVWTEAQSTLMNPAYIKEMQKGSASSAEKMAETFRNTYGWNVMKPEAIKDEMWDQLYETYIDDKYELGVQDFFEGQNPYALQDMTAVMMETARKGMWEASDQQLSELATLHADLIEKYDAGCSGFVCDNMKLRDFISERLPENMKQNYDQKIKQAVEAPSVDSADSIVMKREEVVDPLKDQIPLIERLNWGMILGFGYVFFTIIFLASRRRHAAYVSAE